MAYSELLRTRTSALRAFVLPFAITLGALFGVAAFVLASTVTVTNTTDFGAGSLRDAINQANAGTCTSPCIIDINLTGPGTITSSSGPYTISADNVTVVNNTGAGNPSTIAVTYPIGEPVFNILGDNVTIDGIAIHGASGRQVVVGGVSGFTLNDSWIGLNIGGAQGGGSQATGVQLTGSTGASITNSVFGALGFGAEIATSEGVTFQNNTFGVDPTGVTPIPVTTGLFFWGSFENTLPHFVSGNTFRFLAGNGVQVNDPQRAVEIVGNTFLDNTVEGINLGTFGNDNGDTDTFNGNDGQNFPLIEKAHIFGSDLHLRFSVDSSSVVTTQSLLVQIFEQDPGSGGNNGGTTPIYSQCFAGNSVPSQTIIQPAGGLTAGVSEITALATSYTAPGCASASVNDGTSEFAGAAAIGSGYIVDTTADTIAADGFTSLREAITTLNADPACATAPCEIHFNIPNPPNGPNGTWVIQPTSPLPSIAMTNASILGATQTAFLGDTNPAGPEIVLNGSLAGPTTSGLTITDAFNVTIRDLVIQQFGGHGILIAPSSGGGGHLLFGNYIGTDATGSSAAGNGGDGIRTSDTVPSGGTDGSSIGSSFPGWGNVISGNAGYGVRILSPLGTDDLQGNIIGADRTGTAGIPNGSGGVLTNGSGLTIGQFSLIVVAEGEVPEAGASRRARRRAVQMAESEAPPVKADGALPDPLGNIIAFNTGAGITLGPGVSDTIVGLNWIHSNTGDGVLVEAGTGSGNTITRNSIELNGGLGINLEGGTEDASGVTANDNLETIGAANELLDWPTIVSAYYDGTNTNVVYTFDSNFSIATTYRFEFFKSVAADPSGNGEGEFFLGFQNQAFDSLNPPDGTTQYTASFPGDARGLYATGSSTNATNTGSTSEFSNAVLIGAVDVGVTKTGPANVLVGQTISYVTTATNFGPDTGDTVTVTDTLPAGTTLVALPTPSSSTGTTWTCGVAGSVLTCSTGNMLAGDVTTFAYDVIAPALPGPVSNAVTILSVAGDVEPLNDSDSVTTAVGSAELSIGKVASPDPATVGSPLTYTLTVTNSGDTAAASVSVTDVLDSTVTFVSATGTNWTCSFSAGSVSCSLAGTLAPAGSTTINIVVTPTSVGTVTNTATVGSATPESVSSDNTTTISTAVNLPDSDLSLTKTGPATATVNGPISWTLTVSNAGPAAAANVVVVDSLPAGTTYTGFSGAGWSCTASAGSVGCTLASLASGASSVLTINATAPPTAGNITNIANASSDSNDPAPTNNASSFVTAVALADADLSLNKSGPASVATGQTITYTLVVSNLGPSSATAIVVQDVYDPATTFQSAGGSGWSCAPSTGMVNCSFLSPLAASGSTPALTITVIAPATAGNVTNSATVSNSAENDPVLANNGDSVITAVAVPAADLSISKSGPSVASPGDTLFYTLLITNLGTVPSSNVTVQDVLPSGVTFVSAAGSGWSCSEAGGVVSCFLSSLAGGTSSSISIQATAPSSSGSIVNTASVNSSTTDPVAGNNSSSKATQIENPCPGDRPTLLAPADGSDAGTEVTFRWTVVTAAISYRLMITEPTGFTRLLATIPQPTGGETTLSSTHTLPRGRVIWWVEADYPGNCPPKPSRQWVVIVTACPTAAPQLIAPPDGSLITATPVTFRWTAVSEAVRYDLFVSYDEGAFQPAGSVDGSVAEPSLEVNAPAGSSVQWYVDAIYPDGCPPVRSPTFDNPVACYPPIISVQGEVTMGKPYEVRATIISEGLSYDFQESATPDFSAILDTKPGELSETGEYIFALFEHDEFTEPTPLYYRARVNQSGCGFSDVGRIVLKQVPQPIDDIDVVVQFGVEEAVTRQLLVPLPELGNFTFTVEVEGEWITATPSSGTATPEGALLTVTIEPEGLPVGTTTGTIIVTFTPIESSGKQATASTPIKVSKPVTTTLVTPVTNTGKTPPPPEALVVAAVANAAGINSEWQSDVRLVNLGANKTRYNLTFTPSATDATQNSKTASIELQPGQTTALDDVVRHWYGIGSIPTEQARGVLEIRPIGPVGKTGQSEVTKSLSSIASSRTYNATPAGTLGQFIPAVPFASFVGGVPAEGQKKSVLSLQQLAQTSAFRTNLGLVEAAGQPADVVVRFYDAGGALLKSLNYSLKPGEHRQLDQVLVQNGLTDLADARAEVEVVSGAGKVTAYASVIDNGTNDPLLVEAVDISNLSASRYVVPGVADISNAQNNWRSDLRLFNAGTTPVQATVQFYRTGQSAPDHTMQVELQPGAVRALNDIVGSVFGQTNVGGAVQVLTATPSQLVVTARTYDEKATGTYGQFIPAVTEADAIGLGDRAMQILQIEESSFIRTNLGLVEVTGQPVQIELSAFAAESRATPKVTLSLKANEFRQLNQVLKSLNMGTTYNGRIALRVLSGSGKIAAYGSAVDNKSQDPTYVPGQ